MIKKILTMRAGSDVQRYHTARLIVGETVGHHSANVALIVSQLINPISSNLLMAALMHDLAEQYTGDVPATAKWVSVPLKRSLDMLENFWHEHHDLFIPELTEREAKVLKEADMLDLCFKMLEEYQMGNCTATTIFDSGIAWLEGSEPTAVTNRLIEQLKGVMYE